jgi:arginase
VFDVRVDHDPQRCLLQVQQLREHVRLRVSAASSTAYLLYPEWQGYGVANAVHRGAVAMAHTLFPNVSFTTTDNPLDETLTVRDGVLGLDSIAARFRATLAALRENGPDQLVTIGGTCGVEAAPVAYLNERYDGDLAVVWFDAHGDLNSPETSPSGHFHGMVLRTLTGEGPRDYVDAIRRPLQPRQIVLAGTRDLDSGELAYIRQHGVTVVDPDALRDPDAVTGAIRACGFANVYLHLDLDCFRPDEIPDTLMRTPGGPAFDEVAAALALLRRSFHVAGWSLVEYVDRGGTSLGRLKEIVQGPS